MGKLDKQIYSELCSCCKNFERDFDGYCLYREECNKYLKLRKQYVKDDYDSNQVHD